MSSTLTVVNPRRRRRRKHRAHARRKSTRRRRRAPLFAMNPRRRRRRASAHRRTHRRHRRRVHNPRLSAPMNALMAGAAVGVGIYAVNVAVKALNAYTPLKVSGWGETIAKAGIGLVGIPLALKVLPIKLPESVKRGVMLGAGAVVALDLLESYLTPALPAQLHGYAMLSGYSDHSNEPVGQSRLSGAPNDMYSGGQPNAMYR